MPIRATSLAASYLSASCALGMKSSRIEMSPPGVDGDSVQAQGGIETVGSLGAGLCVGDIVCIHVTAKPFREVAAATGSWINHVGIVVDTAGDQPLIAESTFPCSRLTSLSRFIARSKRGRVAVARLSKPLTSSEEQHVRAAAGRRMGVFYDTGFNLHSLRQFCSRYVREVIEEATGVRIGDIETFAALYSRRPQAELRFWRFWYFGHIPWKRQTVTPASLLRSPHLRCVFDGVATDATVG
ncbi:Permuted papain-like amidase enzyme, YaeF/YiiX, C92 family [Paraburkholderia phenazinium]|uniref:Permuted papain-like amidase enzyme, YaeF/YiiX, C92 family n=2 Tax=Paraburkholderia phenazinium TaxID=60549 RepID=A0A1G8MAP8_9BURK|nr:Permuted papain-like amidase enzyme, YaeF/YiiX, C92 family [Paraburkholderia phenazinium]